MADDIVVDVSFKGNAPDFLAELSRAVGRAKQQLQEMGQTSGSLSRLETQLAQMSQRANESAQASGRAASAMQGWSQKWTPFKGQFQDAENASKNLWKSIDGGISSSEASIGRATTAIGKFTESQRAASQQRIQGNAMADWDKDFARLNAAVETNQAKLRAAKQAVDDYNNSLSNSRYVMYDVAGTLGVLGAGLLAPLVAVVGVAAQMQDQFAQVQRTSGLAGSGLADLKADFDDLYSVLPVTYEELTKIGTLAGQLGIDPSQIADFTEVVAMLATTTDLTAEKAAEGLGRISSLVPGVKGNYDRLASSILNVGVNSAATESAIVKTTVQISSMGVAMGLTAPEIVGLAGALASVGAPPELSRGRITALFTSMSGAVSSGGEKLDLFARISGRSAEEFRNGFGKEGFGDVVLDFFQGLGESDNSLKVLQDLGLASALNTPVFQRLATAMSSTGEANELLRESFGNAIDGYTQNIELQKQFDIQSGTLAKTFQVLVNNLNLFLQAIGGPGLAGLTDFTKGLTDIVKGATDFVSSDFGGAVARVAIAIGAMLGVLALVGAAFALIGASSIGVYQGLQFIAGASPRAAAGLLGTAGAAQLADGSLKAGSASALLFSRALKAISIVGAILILPDAIKAIGGAFDGLAGKTGSVAAEAKALYDTEWINQNALAGIKASTDGLMGQRGVLQDVVNSTTSAGRAFIALDDAMGLLADAGDFKGIATQLNEIKDASGQSGEAVLETFGGLVNKAREAGVELQVVNGQIVASGEAGSMAAGATGEFEEALSAIEEDAAAADEALKTLKDSLDAITGAFTTTSAAQDALQSAVNKANEAILAEGVSFEGTNNASIGFREALRDIDQKAKDVAYSIIEQNGTVDDAMGKWQDGRNRLLDLVEGFFESRDAAAAWADQNIGSAAQTRAALQQTYDKINAAPTSKTVTIGVLDQATGTINGIYTSLSRIQSKTITVTTIESLQRQDAAMARRNAEGGPIYGPGTGTSDSILSWLSNGEYVLRAKAVRAIGVSKLDYANSTGKLPAFATGGQVGRAAPAPVSVSYPNSVVVELSPTDRMLLAQAGNVSLMIDGKTIQGATNSANFVSAQRGSN